MTLSYYTRFVSAVRREVRPCTPIFSARRSGDGGGHGQDIKGADGTEKAA